MLPMKFLLGAAATLILLAADSRLAAQTNAAPVAPSEDKIAREKSMLLSFLTPEQQEQYAKARARALQDNPDLAAEGKTVAEQGLAARSPEDVQTFRERMISHRQKLRAAMLKEDATLGPIFAEIDQHISEEKAKHLGQVQSSGPPNTPQN